MFKFHCPRDPHCRKQPPPPIPQGFRGPCRLQQTSATSDYRTMYNRLVARPGSIPVGVMSQSTPSPMSRRPDIRRVGAILAPGPQARSALAVRSGALPRGLGIVLGREAQGRLHCPPGPTEMLWSTGLYEAPWIPGDGERGKACARGSWARRVVLMIFDQAAGHPGLPGGSGLVAVGQAGPGQPSRRPRAGGGELSSSRCTYKHALVPGPRGRTF